VAFNDNFIAHLKARGYSGETYNDLLKDALETSTGSTGSIDDLWKVYLAAFTGNRANRLEQYIDTNFFYEGVLQDKLATLVEDPISTNLLLHSEDFTNAVWSRLSSGDGSLPIVTANAGVAPDGSLTADRVVLDQGTVNLGDDFSILRQVVTAVDGTASLYMKSNTGANFTVSMSSDGNPNPVVVTSEWQRFTASAASASRVHLALRNSSINNTADLLVWGAQLEAQPSASGFIRTTTSAKTRFLI